MTAINITITLFEDKGIHWEEMEEVKTYARVGHEDTAEFAAWLVDTMYDLAQNNNVDLVPCDFDDVLGRLEAFGVDATPQINLKLNTYGVMFELTKTARN